MSEKIRYEFDGFQLDPVARSLTHHGEPVSIRPIAFELLLVLVGNHGQALTKVELIKRVWKTEGDDDRNFHVTLSDVRKALADSAKSPRFIILEPSGYRFAANVRVLGLQPRMRSQHFAHVFFSSAVYAALCGFALFLEIAYQFDRYGRSALKIAPLVFAWVALTSVTALMVDQKLTSWGRTSGLATATLISFGASGMLFAALTPFLPDHSITVANFPTYTAQAAYLKDLVYFSVLVFLFLTLPFHFITTMEDQVQRGNHQAVLEVLTGDKLAVLPRRTIYLRFWPLAVVLLVFGMMSIPMTAHLLDNLQPGTFRNLFSQLVYLRAVLYFGLGIECLAWYYSALADMKRDCVSALQITNNGKYSQP